MAGARAGFRCYDRVHGLGLALDGVSLVRLALVALMAVDGLQWTRGHLLQTLCPEPIPGHGHRPHLTVVQGRGTQQG